MTTLSGETSHLLTAGPAAGQGQSGDLWSGESHRARPSQRVMIILYRAGRIRSREQLALAKNLSFRFKWIRAGIK